MVMVPVLVVMSGALAFSAFSGTATTNVSATAGYISWDQSLVNNYTYMNNTNVVINSSSVSSVHTGSNAPNMTDMSVGITNLAPGNWVELNFSIKNTGSVGLMFSLGTKTTTISYSNGTTGYNKSVSSSDFTYGKELNNGYNGYEYAVSGLPSGSVDVGSSVTFHVFIGLDNAAGFGQYEQNNLEGSHFTLGVDITVSSDP